ncbi:hypothetical protein HS088_TW23G00846 [Tripterygium wilfordii]|uniref:Miraculin-like n=1 Tax=Tripterygium wilfordii TaxID=458696 RepID=A0A7J7BWQ3_TRIWF|nr:kunitz trypsin inhibitor 5-like [Tripterygium wilfordii]KAF5726105.1 hypothetical protein HS088_TW23G00846 [Tripterygium wilfordii]
MGSTLLLLFSLVSTSVLAASAADPVLDLFFEEVKAGVEYYILPGFHRSGGGLNLKSSTNESCPVDVVQEEQDESYGLTLKFSPAVSSSNGVVITSTDLNIKLSHVENCEQSTVWQIQNYADDIGPWLIKTGAAEGNPGPNTVGNWFKIDKFGGDYKLVYCPTVCDSCKVTCGDVGLYVKNGMRHLALTTKPYKVIFQKA